MRLLPFVLFAIACARSTMPVAQTLRYDCQDAPYVRTGDTLASGSDVIPLDSRDDDFDHFFVSRGSDAFELAVPKDPHSDATKRVFAANGAAARTTVRSEVCRVRGGYSDVAIRYIAGESIDQIASTTTNGDRAAAYELVHQGMIEFVRKLGRDR